MDYPRVLVVSNNSFSHTSSNGRTLGNYFIGWPKDRLAQFCISTVEPAFDICENYYICTDKNALDSFKRMSKASRLDIKDCVNTEANTIIRSNRKSFKTSTKALLRHIVWRNRWNSDSFWRWIDEFAPEVVFLMNSDATFILDIATEVSKKRKIPLVMFNTEGYYFFKNDYNRQERAIDKWSFLIYQRIYRRCFERTMKQVSLSIYCNSVLQNDYVKRFGGSSIVLYTSSAIEYDASNLHVDHPTFSYLGNFGFDRPTALIEIAEVLRSIDPGYKLDVYGNIPGPEIKERFDACDSICYKGMVPYDEVVKVMYSSTILFHAEVQDEKFEESLRYGFTTKIADSISCGHPFLMYSSPNIAGAKYIIETGAAWQAKDKQELKSNILSILKDDVQRNKVLGTAKNVAIKNHNVENNSKVFKDVLVNS